MSLWGQHDVARPWEGSGTNIWTYREDIWGQSLECRPPLMDREGDTHHPFPPPILSPTSTSFAWMYSFLHFVLLSYTISLSRFHLFTSSPIADDDAFLVISFHFSSVSP